MRDARMSAAQNGRPKSQFTPSDHQSSRGVAPVARARARLLELSNERPIERLAIIHSRAAGIDTFRAAIAAVTGVPQQAMEMELVGPSIAPHVGPGAFGFAVLAREA